MSALTLLTLTLAALATAKPNRKPNIVLIRESNDVPPHRHALTLPVTDDQDVGTLRKAEWLPRIHQYLIGEGVLYDNFFAPVRASATQVGKR